MAVSPEKGTREPSSSNKFLKFSGIAFQLAILLALAIWAGTTLDAKLGNDMQYMTALLVVLAFAGFMFKLLRDLKNL